MTHVSTHGLQVDSIGSSALAALFPLPDDSSAFVNVHLFFVWLEFKSSLVTILNRHLMSSAVLTLWTGGKFFFYQT